MPVLQIIYDNSVNLEQEILFKNFERKKKKEKFEKERGLRFLLISVFSYSLFMYKPENIVIEYENRIMELTTEYLSPWNRQ